MTTLTREAAIYALDRKIAELSFADFLTHISVRSDDPLNPVVSEWQPWDYLIEQARAWESGQSEIDLKDRQLGYSWLAAAYAVWRARNGAAVGLISKGQLEARELLAKCAFVEASLPEFMRQKVVARVDDMKYRSGGGFIMAFPSTPDAGVSFTFQVVIMDEAHFHPYASQNYAAIRPTISAGGQFIVLSTADPALGPYGWFPEMYWASKRGETGYTAKFIPWSVRPGRDQAWFDRERAAYSGMQDEFDAYYADTDAQAFTGRSGLVYPQWSDTFVVQADPFAWLDAKYRVGGVDFGGGDPTAVLALGVSGTRQVHQFEEMYERGPVTVEQIGQWLRKRHDVAPFIRIACDPSQGIAIASLRAMGLPAMPADNARDGIGVLAGMLDAKRFTVNAQCVDSVAEFPGYRWANRTDPNDRTRYATSTPVDHHADAMDARRYALKVIEAIEIQMPRQIVGIQIGQQKNPDADKPALVQKLRTHMREQTKPQSVRVR